MLKLTKTGIGLLTKQYRSVLRKCLLLNLCLFTTSTIFTTITTQFSWATDNLDIRAGNGQIAILTETDYNSGRLAMLWSGTEVVNVSSMHGGELYIRNHTLTGESYLSGTAFKLNNSGLATGIDFATNVTAGTTNASHLATTGAVNQLLNYYYTFRVDERVEAIEFAKELRSNKKEMSSLDFMPIKSSSDLRINLIKAEDPLTFSAKTRDDSLVLMEVCHA